MGHLILSSTRHLECLRVLQFPNRSRPFMPRPICNLFRSLLRFVNHRIYFQLLLYAFIQYCDSIYRLMFAGFFSSQFSSAYPVIPAVGTPAGSEAMPFSSIPFNTPYPSSAPPIPGAYYSPSPVNVSLSLAATQKIVSIPGAGTPQSPVSASLEPLLGMAISPSIIPPQQQQVHPPAVPPGGSFQQTQPDWTSLSYTPTALQTPPFLNSPGLCVSAEPVQVSINSITAYIKAM